jgi:hypothetical protein
LILKFIRTLLSDLCSLNEVTASNSIPVLESG